MAKRVVDGWCIFQDALTRKGRYPKEKFDAFLRSARNYAEATRNDRLIQRDVAAIISGLGEQLRLERKRVPGQVLYEANHSNVYSFQGTIPILKVMSPQDFDPAPEMLPLHTPASANGRGSEEDELKLLGLKRLKSRLLGNWYAVLKRRSGTCGGGHRNQRTFPRSRLRDNNDLLTLNILTSLISGHRTAARSEAGQGFVCPAIPFRV